MQLVNGSCPAILRSVVGKLTHKLILLAVAEEAAEEPATGAADWLPVARETKIT